LSHALKRLGLLPSRFILCVSVAKQSMRLFERRCERASGGKLLKLGHHYVFRRQYRISTSAFGTGQLMASNRTPLGLHRIAAKVGAGHPIGTVFKGRKPVGFTWQGQPNATIVHRILWLEGLERGFNRSGKVDSFQRYIYLHGFGDETTLGQPASHGCIHLGAADLIPLFDRIPSGTMVWIAA
jgi:L,D-transpeptidase YbiS